VQRYCKLKLRLSDSEYTPISPRRGASSKPSASS
jgi:hypothetical protein